MVYLDTKTSVSNSNRVNSVDSIGKLGNSEMRLGDCILACQLHDSAEYDPGNIAMQLYKECPPYWILGILSEF